MRYSTTEIIAACRAWAGRRPAIRRVNRDTMLHDAADRLMELQTENRRLARMEPFKDLAARTLERNETQGHATADLQAIVDEKQRRVMTLEVTVDALQADLENSRRRTRVTQEKVDRLKVDLAAVQEGRDATARRFREMIEEAAVQHQASWDRAQERTQAAQEEVTALKAERTRLRHDWDRNDGVQATQADVLRTLKERRVLDEDEIRTLRAEAEGQRVREQVNERRIAGLGSTIAKARARLCIGCEDGCPLVAPGLHYRVYGDPATSFHCNAGFLDEIQS